MKVVINRCYGGFGLSEEGKRRYMELAGVSEVRPDEIDRADPHLIQVIEELGEKANGLAAKLLIQDVPEGVYFHIAEYDGSECIMTQHDYHWIVATK